MWKTCEPLRKEGDAGADRVELQKWREQFPVGQIAWWTMCWRCRRRRAEAGFVTGKSTY
jgi:hypothetical protein